MVLFWLAQEAGVKATSRDNGAATSRVAKEYRELEGITQLHGEKEKRSFETKLGL